MAVWWQFSGRGGHFGVLRRGIRLRADRSVSLQDSIRGAYELRGPGAEGPRERWRSSSTSAAVEPPLEWRFGGGPVADEWRL